MRTFVSELRRRNVIRAAAFYAASAWLVVQVATQVFPFFDVPTWTVRWIVVAAVIGFPFLIAFAWFYEITPQGLKRESEVDRDDSMTRQTGRRLDRWIIAVMGIAIVALLADQFVMRPSASTAPAATPAEATPASTAQVGAAPEKSIAVLPFTDMSPGHDQEYFSDGVAEELLNALAKLRDLKVAGRTSSFSFKGKNDDLRTIGKALGVANILEGSLRKQGDQVRITAQLIQVSDGFHLWSDTYDGDVRDVFALQEHIAVAIAEKLELVLDGGPDRRIVPVATTNPEAYALYLEATRTFDRREGTRFPDAIAQLERAIVLDPKFARAHARLAALMAIGPTYTVLDPDAATASVEAHARMASALDPSLAEPYAALGQSLSIRRRYVEARIAFEHARGLDPADTTASLWYATELIMTGYRRQGDVVLDDLLAIDPMLPTALLWRGAGYAYEGDYVNAEPLLKRASDAKLKFAGLGLSYVDDWRHEKAAAIAHLTESFGALDTGLPKDSAGTLANGIVGDDSAHARALDMIHRYLDSKPPVVSGVVVYCLMRLGEPERALEVLERSSTTNDAVFLALMWSPYGRDVRLLPQFPAFTRRIGFADVWDKYGAPDGCARAGSGDYVCQ